MIEILYISIILSANNLASEFQVHITFLLKSRCLQKGQPVTPTTGIPVAIRQTTF